jgi:hypothetical protein
MRAPDRLASPRLIWRLPLLALLLTLPALATGWQFDDYLHRAALTASADRPSLRPALMDLFVFMDGDPARTQRRMASGEFPWWTLPEGKVAFWRPLSGLTHWLDYRVWPQQPALMHVHSLLWFAALIAAATLLYRRIMGPTALAGLAALLYAVDDAHGFAAAWLSNRNVLLAALCGCLTLLAHDRWRRAGWRPGAFVAPLCLLLGLLSAEAAIAILAYLLAYALTLDRAGWRGRLLALLPALLVVVLWRLVYRALGYGAWGVSYIDPLTEPLRYLRAVAINGPALLLGQWALPPAELFPFAPPWAMRLIWLLGLLTIALLTWMAWSLLRRDGVARFWALGMLLALLPICAALPANRLLFFVGLGAMGVLACLLDDLRRQSRSGRRGPALLAGGALALLHLGLAPLLLPLTAWSPALLGNIEPSIASLPRDAAFMDQTAIILNAPSFFSTSYIPLVRRAQGLPSPARIRYLGAGPVALDVQRSDERTLIVQPAGGYLTGFDLVFRDPAYQLTIGQSIALPDVRVTILSTTVDGRPLEVAFQFAAPLDDPGLRWLQWRAGRYAPFTPPAVGQSVLLPAATPWPALLGSR